MNYQNIKKIIKTTLYYLKDYFKELKSLKIIPVYPTFKYSQHYYAWDFNILSIFLNEMHDFTPKHHGYELKDDTFCFHFHIINNNLVDKNSSNDINTSSFC